MKKEQLEKAIELKKEIEELEKFLEGIKESLEGSFIIRKPFFLFKYKSWFNKEKSYEVNKRLAFRILLEIEKELEDLKKQFENL